MMKDALDRELVRPAMPRDDVDEVAKQALSKYVNSRLDGDALKTLLRCHVHLVQSGLGMTRAETAAVKAIQAGDRAFLNRLLAQKKPLSKALRQFILDQVHPPQNRRRRPLNWRMRDIQAYRASPESVKTVYLNEDGSRGLVNFSTEQLKDRVLVLVLVASDYRRIMTLFRQEYGSAYGRQKLAAELACRRWGFRHPNGAWAVDNAVGYVRRGRVSAAREAEACPYRQVAY